MRPRRWIVTGVAVGMVIAARPVMADGSPGSRSAVTTGAAESRQARAAFEAKARQELQAFDTQAHRDKEALRSAPRRERREFASQTRQARKDLEARQRRERAALEANLKAREREAVESRRFPHLAHIAGVITSINPSTGQLTVGQPPTTWQMIPPSQGTLASMQLLMSGETVIYQGYDELRPKHLRVGYRVRVTHTDDWPAVARIIVVDAPPPRG